MSSPEVAVFGIERTITDSVLRHALGDIAVLGLSSPEVESASSAFRIAQQRSAFNNWFIDRDESDIEQFLDKTAVEAPGRVAEWAKLIISAEYEEGRQICIYSSTLPQKVVEAYAEGIENDLQDVEIEWAMGKPAVIENGKYTGQTGSMLKAEQLERLTARYGLSIDFVADSFYTAWPAIAKGRRRLHVNPDKPLLESRYSRGVPVLNWLPDDIHTRLIVPGDPWERLYDLTEEADRGMLLADLGH